MTKETQFSTVQGNPYKLRAGDRIIWDRREGTITLRTENTVAILVNKHLSLSTSDLNATDVMGLVAQLAKEAGQGVRLADERQCMEIYELTTAK